MMIRLLNKKRAITARQRILSIQVIKNILRLRLLEQGQTAQSEDILLRESSREEISRRLRMFTEAVKANSPRYGHKPKVIWILSRSEVIQKTFELEGTSEAGLRDEVIAKIKNELPFPVKEMTYGLHIYRIHGKYKALLAAIPEKNISGTLQMLTDQGMMPDDIITEDQALFWFALNEGIDDQALLLDRNADRILVVYLQNLRMEFSHALKTEDGNAGRSLYEELPLLMLDKGLFTGRLYLSGSWPEEDRRELEMQYPGRVERFHKADGELSSSEDRAILQGIGEIGSHPVLSLLPQPAKLKRVRTANQKLLRESAGVLILVCLLPFIFHQANMLKITRQTDLMARKQAELEPEYRTAKKITHSLSVLSDAQNTKLRVLDLFRSLAQEMPDSIQFEQLELDEEGLDLKGESQSHAGLAEAVNRMEQIPVIQNVRLERTRLRKKMGHEYFEFEINADWGMT